MYRRFNESDGNVLGYHISGSLTAAEVKEMQREIGQAIDTHGMVRLLCEFGDLQVPSAAAIWEDLKFTPQYVTSIERFALVGDKRWHTWLGQLSRWLTKADARAFEGSQLPEAWSWLKAA
jgi:hypothetical protein